MHGRWDAYHVHANWDRTPMEDRTRRPWRQQRRRGGRRSDRVPATSSESSATVALKEAIFTPGGFASVLTSENPAYRTRASRMGPVNGTAGRAARPSAAVPARTYPPKSVGTRG